MNRRAFIRQTAASTAAVAIGAPANLSQPLPDSPNVLFILYDDMNDWIGCLGGHPQALTPNLDALADSGVLFANAQANATICCPSRTTILSGRRPSTTGVYNNESIWSNHIPQAVMMPWNFLQHGYHIYRVGKFCHPPEIDYWHQSFDLTVRGRPPTYPLNFNNMGDLYFDKFDWGPTIVPVNSLRDGRFTRFAIDRLQGDVVAPFFLAVGYRCTHDPWYIPKQFFHDFPLDSIELPELPEDELADIPPYPFNSMIRHLMFQEVRKNQQWRKAVQAYLAALAFADYQIGQLMNALENSRYADDTIVVLTSDHGIHLGEKGHWTKDAAWREDSHIPLIWRVPGVTPAGAVSQYATELIDIYPTLIDLCGLSSVPEMEGQTIRPQLENPALPFNRPAIVTVDHNIHAIVSNRYRMISYHDTELELYDHLVDPREHNNIADEPGSAPIIAALSEWLPDYNADP